MNIKKTLRNLPVIAVLAVGLALSPTYSMADDGDRGKHRGQYSHDKGNSHNKESKSGRQHKVRFYDERGHRDIKSARHDKRYKSHGGYKNSGYKNGSHKSDHRGHKYSYRGKHRDGHRHGHDRRSHNHDSYVVNAHNHRSHHIDFDDLRFMVGLHTDNFDIILRD